MKVSTEQGADRQAVVQVEVEPAELEAALEKAYRRVVKQVNIHGFRPGKAPRRIVEQRLGRLTLVQEAAQDLVPELTNKVIVEQEIDAIAEPSIEITGLEPLSFTATFPLRPTVTLGDYQAIRLAPPEVGVTDEQVDEVVERLRNQHATWAAPEEPRPAAEGDQATIDLASLVDGEPMEEPESDITTVLGERGGLLPEIQAAITGLNVGETGQARIPFAEDHREERVAGKEVVFDVTLKDLKQKQLPAVDDEFARLVGDVETAAELYERIRHNLTTQAENEARQKMANAVIKLVTDLATVEMPPVLVENQIDHLLQERRQMFERQGLRWNHLLELSGRTEEQMREEFRAEADRRVRGSLVLLEIAKAEDITVTDEEVQAEAERLIAAYPENEQPQMRRTFGREGVRRTIEHNLLEQKILDRLVEIATEGRGYTVAPGEAPPFPSIDDILGTTPAAELDAEPDAEPDVEPDEAAQELEAEAVPAPAATPAGEPEATAEGVPAPVAERTPSSAPAED